MTDTESLYPEHGKLETVKAQSQAIGEFLAWLGEKGISLGKYEQEECDNSRCDGEDCEGISVFHQYQPNLNTTLAEFFSIDYEALMREKDKMLEEIRRQQGVACDQCGKAKPDVQRRVDPFTAEIDNKEVWMNLCDDCTRQSADDV
jgi:ssDNA-binding Zn-finger/Zn-ribbon topoisomerase 1